LFGDGFDNQRFGGVGVDEFGIGRVQQFDDFKCFGALSFLLCVLQCYKHGFGFLVECA
jgi:hypothetical protein